MTKKNEKESEIAAIKNYLLPFLNLHKQHPFLPGARNIKGQAAFIGISESDLSDARQNYIKTAKNAALELLKQDEIIEGIQEMPFRDGETVMVIGDSLTDDTQGWFEILKYVFDLEREDKNLVFINSAIYGSTSIDCLRRLDRDLALHNPDWVIFAIGSIDAQYLRGTGERTMVSIAEFYENILTMESMASEVSQNPLIWVTPPEPITELMEDMPLFQGVLHERELSQFREVIAGKPGYVVDPKGIRFGQPAEAWNYLADGFHPSIAGHSETVKWFIRTLSTQKRSTKGATISS